MQEEPGNQIGMLAGEVNAKTGPQTASHEDWRLIPRTCRADELGQHPGVIRGGEAGCGSLRFSKADQIRGQNAKAPGELRVHLGPLKRGTAQADAMHKKQRLPAAGFMVNHMPQGGVQHLGGEDRRGNRFRQRRFSKGSHGVF